MGHKAPSFPDGKGPQLHIEGNENNPTRRPVPISPLAPKSPVPPRKQVILLVDDEADIRDSMRELLEVSLKNIRVLVADSGDDALSQLQGEPVDLIVTDYKMPGMTGLEFLAAARQTVAGVPRILMTAFPDLDLAMRAINEEEIEKFFTKPLDPAKVVETVREILLERRAEELRGQAFARALDEMRRQSKSA
jgi:response regulator RpfG family c-di-GMP phosphodiesterase